MESFIIIGQYYGKSFMSRLIKWRTWSPISHSAALSHDEQFVYEAWGKGVFKTAWENSHHKPGTKVDLFKVPCTHEECKNFYAYLESQTGKKYGFRAIIGFVLRLPLLKAGELICSQYIFNGGLAMPRKFLERIEPYKVSPGHLHLSPMLEYYKTVSTP